MRDFYVRSCETCPECDGDGYIDDVDEDGCLEKCECLECGGSGKVHRDVNLIDALHEIAAKNA